MFIDAKIANLKTFDARKEKVNEEWSHIEKEILKSIDEGLFKTSPIRIKYIPYEDIKSKLKSFGYKTKLNIISEDIYTIIIAWG